MSGREPSGIAPFFIVRDLPTAFDFYRDELGFDIMFATPSRDPQFGIVRRGAAMIFLKAVNAEPEPNPERDRDARWDAFVNTPDPDLLAEEFAAQEVAFKAPIADTEDGLRGFEVADADGYVLFFGRPR